jgi:zinc protease
VIGEERRQRIDSMPDGALDEEVQRRFWGQHPYALPAGGTAESIPRLRREQAEAFLATHYGASELTAVLVGDFAVERARDLARSYFGRLPSERTVSDTAAAGRAARRDAEGAGSTPAATSPGGSVATHARPAASRADATAERAASTGVLERRCACPPQARVLYRTVPADHPDRAALDVLAGVLAGRSGRLHRTLVLERGLAFGALARHDTGRRAGFFAIELETRGEVAPAELVVAWDEEVARLQAAPPTAEELTRVRNQVTTGAWRGLREPLDFALRLLHADAQAGWRTLETWPATVSAVTGEEVRRVAREYLAPDRRLVVHATRGAGK